MSDFPKSDPNKGIKVLYLINIIPKKQKIQNHLLIKSAPTIGIVVNPYMGDDVFIPFIENKQKVAIALIQTSNIEAKAIQELRLESGKML